MALPVLLRKLFDSDGAGSKLKESIMPDTVVKASEQTLADDAKAQARTNIDAVSESDLKTALEELITEYGGTVPTE
jgi:hypothetical protein